MSRHALIRVMLSLLLLISQQLALTHAMSHWSATLNGASHAARTVQHGGADDSGLSKSAAQDQVCHQCLAFAQLANLLGNSPWHVAPDKVAALALAATSAQPGCVRAECGFQPRAPPAAV